MRMFIVRFGDMYLGESRSIACVGGRRAVIAGESRLVRTVDEAVPVPEDQIKLAEDAYRNHGEMELLEYCGGDSREDVLGAMRKALDGLRKDVEEGRTGRARGWGGCGVIICSSEDDRIDGDFCVVTPYAPQVSWLFERLTKAFSIDRLVDYLDKYSFYKRLALAAGGAVRKGLPCRDVLLKVLDEADSYYEEVKPVILEVF